ncbi:hypothetical protein B9479_001254 [Cryptococcus floricola]|uniref:Uncharacterized protein n=1 Tax=Cryptococcus floricola TaxID=2591691 RepID=A0A5D3B5I0_9TREE|nr:hypothetical protein B9479_001254 [Cryptococcus floricola]
MLPRTILPPATSAPAPPPCQKTLDSDYDLVESGWRYVSERGIYKTKNARRMDLVRTFRDQTEIVDFLDSLPYDVNHENTSLRYGTKPDWLDVPGPRGHTRRR